MSKPSDDAQKARACRSVEIEDETGAAIILKETPDRTRLLVYTKADKKGGDHRVFLTLEQIDYLRYAMGYALDLHKTQEAESEEQVVNLTDPDLESAEAF